MRPCDIGHPPLSRPCARDRRSVTYHGQQFLEIKMAERRGGGPGQGGRQGQLWSPKQEEGALLLGSATKSLQPLELERQMKMENLFVTWQQRFLPQPACLSV